MEIPALWTRSETIGSAGKIFLGILTISSKVVIPAQAGIQIFCKGSKILDPGLRRDDGKRVFSTFYETINIGTMELWNDGPQKRIWPFCRTFIPGFG
ncbi:MAG: hypothetical protein CVU64_00615 [Deltaproteobacteria bacterium HGW-Deltaproteobacteria-21]|nr:MAG: hypothetical protein CVU64_00615 [Deltaproteobacteria bacterium HGW-Deltaproteobacteria-21]